MVVIKNRKKVKGIDSLTELDQRPKLRARRLSVCLQRTWPSYAHFSLYTIRGDGGDVEENWPRINKPALGDLRDNGFTVEIRVIACEYDNDNHEPLDLAGYEDLVSRIRSVKNPNTPQPTLIYKTRAGARLVFVLALAITPEQAEPLHLQIVKAYHNEGIPLTGDTWEWNRLHALPFVQRDGEDLNPEPFSWGPVLTELPNLPDHVPAPRASTLRLDMPEIPDAEALVWDEHNKLTPWGKDALKRMKGRDAEVAFDRALAPTLTDKRNPTLFSWAGSLCAMLRGNPKGTSPAHVFGVLTPTATASMSDGDSHRGRNLIAEVWKAVVYCWGEEQALHEHHAEQSATFLGQLRHSMSWAALPAADDEAAAFLRRRLLAIAGTDVYVLGANGLYAPTPVKPLGVVSSLRESGLVGPGKLLPDLRVRNATGGDSPLTGQAALDRFGTVVSGVEVRPGLHVGGTVVAGALHLSPFTRRTDLAPKFHRWVQEWIQALFVYNEAKISKAENWIAACLSPEKGPLAALSLRGPGGIGKDFLITALSRALTCKTFATGSVFSNYQYFVDKTPLVFVNETWPDGVKSVDKRLRELIGGSSFEVKQKWQAHSKSYLQYRVLMMANTDAVISKLFARRGVSEDERRATMQRVIHMDVSFTPPEQHPARLFWLANAKRGWTEEVLEEAAAHFLWLQQELPQTLTDRFLMTGDENDPYLRGLAFGDEDQAEVGQLLLAYYEAGQAIDDKVSAGDLLAYRDGLLFSQQWSRYNVVSIGRALSTFRIPGTRKIHLETLYRFAKAAELACPHLKRALRGKEAVHG